MALRICRVVFPLARSSHYSTHDLLYRVVKLHMAVYLPEDWERVPCKNVALTCAGQERNHCECFGQGNLPLEHRQRLFQVLHFVSVLRTIPALR